MKNKSVIIIFAVILSLLMIACDNADEVIIDDKTTQIAADKSNSTSGQNEEKIETEENIIETPIDEKSSTVENDKETISNSDGDPVFKQSISISPIYSINKEKVNEAIDMGFPSPTNELDLYSYTPNNRDAIQYNSQKSSFELGESIRHNGFDGIEVVYERTQYKWNCFFDDLDVSEDTHNITVNLKGNSIYEADIADEYSKFYRYYDENKGLYYEVQDLMMGNFIDPDAVLTNKRIGMSCNYKTIYGLTEPTYNPLVLENNEESVNYFITVIDDKPCIYVETLLDEKLHKKWIDINYGVIVKELIFDNEGLLEEEKIAVSITDKDIDNSLFVEPKDVEYRDITMFIYLLSGGSVETFFEGIFNTIPEENIGIKLVSSNTVVNIYCNGIKEGMLGDVMLDDSVYVTQYTDANGVTNRIRRIKMDRFYTIHDGLEKIEIYDKSCYEQKFFNFTNVILLSVKKNEDNITYAFYDPNNISVSSLYTVYEYVIGNDMVLSINTYEIESITDNKPLREKTTYTIELTKFDESVKV